MPAALSAGVSICWVSIAVGAMEGLEAIAIFPASLKQTGLENMLVHRAHLKMPRSYRITHRLALSSMRHLLKLVGVFLAVCIELEAGLSVALSDHETCVDGPGWLSRREVVESGVLGEVASSATFRWPRGRSMSVSSGY